MYYYIEDDYKVGDLIIKGMEDSERITSILVKGQFSEVKNIVINTSPKNGKKNDFLMTETINIPFVSKKVKTIIQEHSLEAVQFISTNLKGYYLLHVQHHISCFDWKNSKYTKHPPFLNELANIPKTIESLVLDENKIKKDLFRMLEEPITLFISEKLKNIFEKENVTGIKYCAIKDYRKGLLL